MRAMRALALATLAATAAAERVSSPCKSPTGGSDRACREGWGAANAPPSCSAAAAGELRPEYSRFLAGADDSDAEAAVGPYLDTSHWSAEGFSWKTDPAWAAEQRAPSLQSDAGGYASRLRGGGARIRPDFSEGRWAPRPYDPAYVATWADVSGFDGAGADGARPGPKARCCSAYEYGAGCCDPAADVFEWEPAGGERLRTASDLVRAARGRRLVMVGDSVTHQFCEALRCEVARALPAGWAWLDNRLVRAPEPNAEGPVRPTDPWDPNDHSVTFMHVGGGAPRAWVDSDGAGYDGWESGANGTSIGCVKRYVPEPGLLEDVLYLSDIAVVNFALHYAYPNSTAEGRCGFAADAEAVSRALAAFTRSSPNKLGMLREASAQHFGVGSGDFHDVASDAQHTCGGPLRRPGRGWRNDALFELSEYYGIPLVPAFDATRGRADSHIWSHICKWSTAKEGVYACDCTHFCYSPRLWAPWIHSLTLAIEGASLPEAELGQQRREIVTRVDGQPWKTQPL